MNIVENSLTIVLLGDWNKFYVQPEWVAGNIFCKPEMEIGVETQGTEFKISYKCNNVIISPSQEKVIITATNIRESTIKYMVECATNYILNAKTPSFSAYGFNIDFVETDDIILSNMIDDISDVRKLIGLNYAIVSSQITRCIKKDDKLINIQYSQEQKQSNIHFNEHHAETDINAISFDYNNILQFINNSKEILNQLGYDIEDNEND